MSKPININETLTFNPTSNTGTTSLTASSSYPASNGYTDASSTSYARFSVSRNQTGYTYYVFPVSGIPSNATITDVSCTARLYINSTTNVTNTKIQLYTGTTAKGDSNTFASTSTTNTVTIDGGSWTISELANARVRIEGYGSGSNNSSRYIYFFGATLTIQYSISGTAYTITATSSIDGITATPATQDVMSGGDAELIVIEGISDISEIKVLDNNVDVTDQLVRKEYSTGGTIERYPASYMTSGSISGTRYQGTIGKSVDNPSSQTGNDYATSSGSTANINYAFDFSDIPSNATITDMTVTVRGHLESTSQSNEVAQLQLYSGSTAKGSQSSFTSTSNSNIVMTPGTWTRAELDNAILRFTIGYYGGLVVGVTWEVTYAMPSSESQYYYEYSLTNVNADHVITVDQAGAFVPPDEDPQYEYYPITISSINATTTPGRGTTRVVENSSETITIYPSDPLVTLILDNGVDVSNQLVAHSNGSATYTVDSVSGATYGFSLNGSTGYYVSQNTGQSNSAALARINLSLPVRCLITISYINYAESTYDYGIFGNVDTALGTSYTVDSDAKLICNTATYNTSSVQTLTYEIESGNHFIDIKFRKDAYTDSNNDNLQFKIESITELEANNYYTYTLSNIQDNHSLIFVFGEVDYWYVNSSGSGCKLYPDGQFVVLDGDSYRLTIVPNDTNASVSLTDNNNAVQLERVESQVEKDGDTITYVNYIYALSNISATHNLVVTCVSGTTIYLKINDNWETVTKVYKNIDDRWQEVSDFSGLFESNKVYIKI